MHNHSNSTLILALGNDIMGDDGVGLVAGRILHQEFGDELDYIEAAVGGIDLIEDFSGYEHVILLDAIATGNAPAGTIYELSRSDFENVSAPSPHATGLAEALQLARELAIPVPEEFVVLAIKIDSIPELKVGLGEIIQEALPAYLQKARTILREWAKPVFAE